MTKEEVIISQIGVARLLANRISNNTQEKEDVAQDMLLGWVENCGKFNPELGHRLSTFATTVMQNAANHVYRDTNRLKRKAKTVSLEIEDDDGFLVERYLDDEQNIPEYTAECQSMLKYTLRCIKLLPRTQRNHLHLLMLSPDSTLKEVADKNGIDYKSFAFSVRAGRANLKRLMKEV